MTRVTTLTVTSLLSILLFSVHLSDDIVRGFEPGGFKHIQGIVIAAVWLYATLQLSERRLGLTIILLGSMLASLMPLAHMRGMGLVGGRIAGSDGMLLWVWSLIGLGIVSTVTAALCTNRLWRLRKRTQAASA
jgi:hypothetical protein